ncbi:Rieske (2Fe-2S) protein [Streptomyces tricolor]|nr:Rieske (2Fe-2S) protein [Streptomyces tricolor]
MIARALKRAEARPSGNWYVVGASGELRADRPLARTVAGQEVVVWRGPDGRPAGGPVSAPTSAHRCGTVPSAAAPACHWHGLALDGTPHAGWVPLPVHDDGDPAVGTAGRAGR